MDPQNSLKYGLYARKSSESDERQTLSIESQVKEMQDISNKESLLIEKTYREKHSAKQSRSRPRFIELVDDLENQIVNAIIVWAPDRLSRNAGDLGDLVDLMDKGKLLEIKTYNQVFSNSPNHKFLLMILCSQAKLENDNRAINIRRGVKNKYLQGWLAGPAPIGYLNLKIGSDAKIIVDKKKAPYIKQIFEKVGLENMKVHELRVWIDENTSLRTKTGNSLSKSTVYSMLRKHFYYGKLPFKGELLDGSHPAIISKDLFDKVQENLRPIRKLNWTHRSENSVSKFIICGGCGDSVIERHKNRKLKSGGYRKHIYFRCSRFKHPNCKQPSVNYFNLLKQMVDLIDEIDFSNIKFQPEISKKIIDFYFANIICTQDPSSKLLLLRSRNINISEVNIGTIKVYFRYTLLCKEAKKKVELLEALNTKFILKDKTLSVGIINQS
ncbi:recombinase family protein [Candidatus Woesebacteria bacterium]|nr:recombinase family protein [Candidatus Woesebacteria bacterium]